MQSENLANFNTFELSFFLTNKTSEEKGQVLGSISPSFNICIPLTQFQPFNHENTYRASP